MKEFTRLMLVGLILGAIGIICAAVGVFCIDIKPIDPHMCEYVVYPITQAEIEFIPAQSNTPTVEEPEVITLYRVPVTDEEIDLMARCVMSEASILSYEGKLSVASVIINRVLSEYRYYPDTIKEVILQGQAEGHPQFSIADNGEPTEECYRVVFEALETQCFPEDMYWFSSGKPHSFGYEYNHIGNTYFNTESDWEAIVNE